jgi:LacI family transcriptional regulator
VKVTIRDVARAAGVSVATVSRVLNDSGPVHEDTRRRVTDAARTLRYVPHGGARSLITRRTDSVGVLLPDLYGEFFSEVLRGLDLTARQQGFHLLVSGSHSDRAEMAAALRAMRGRVDGLVIMAPDIDVHALLATLPGDQPVVLLNCATTPRDEGARAGGDGAPSSGSGSPSPSPSPSAAAAAGTHALVDAITFDNAGGARRMVRHLLGHGHDGVAIICGAAQNNDARERLRGYHAALRDAGIAPRPEWEVAGDFTEGGGYEATRALLRLDPRPTAIFAANDSMALGALGALHEAGLHVPDDVAVAGFDDIPLARFARPALSSVHVPIAELGERAMARLLQAMANPGTHRPRQEVLDTTLVIRHSCGAPGHS